MPKKISVLIVDDHEVVREGLRSFLNSEDDIEVVAEAGDGESAISLYNERKPDIVIMDVRLPRISGIEATRQILKLDAKARVIVVATFEGDGRIYAALEAGAWAYLIKDAMRREIVAAIRTVCSGKRVLAPAAASTLAATLPRVQLTPRENEVLVLMAKGLRNREIGEALGTTEGTVKHQVKSILHKLDVNDRTEAVTQSLERGLIEL